MTTPPHAPDALTLRAFQQHIRDRYEATDRARGTPATFLWFIEEVGELSHALGKVGRRRENEVAGAATDDAARAAERANLEEEFADVLAWLCTLANINDVDLAGALCDKYLGEKRPEGTK